MYPPAYIVPNELLPNGWDSDDIEVVDGVVNPFLLAQDEDLDHGALASNAIGRALGRGTWLTAMTDPFRRRRAPIVDDDNYVDGTALYGHHAEVA